MSEVTNIDDIYQSSTEYITNRDEWLRLEGFVSCECGAWFENEQDYNSHVCVKED